MTKKVLLQISSEQSPPVRFSGRHSAVEVAICRGATLHNMRAGMHLYYHPHERRLPVRRLVGSGK